MKKERSASLLSEDGDLGAVVVGEHLVGEDGLRHARRVLQVDLEEARLQGCVLRLVASKDVEEEGGDLGGVERRGKREGVCW